LRDYFKGGYDNALGYKYDNGRAEKASGGI